jgi:hypothetical protein
MSVLIFSTGVRSVLSLIGKLIKERYEMVLKRFSRKRADKEEPEYVHTVEHDGRKYIESNEFIKLPHVKRQMQQLDAFIKARRSS